MKVFEVRRTFRRPERRLCSFEFQLGEDPGVASLLMRLE
jgi:hypothetical protein